MNQYGNHHFFNVSMSSRCPLYSFHFFPVYPSVFFDSLFGFQIYLYHLLPSHSGYVIGYSPVQTLSSSVQFSLTCGPTFFHILNISPCVFPTSLGDLQSHCFPIPFSVLLLFPFQLALLLPNTSFFNLPLFLYSHKLSTELFCQIPGKHFYL